MSGRFLTTFQYDYLPDWVAATDRVDWQMSPTRIYRELVARAPDYPAVILMGSTGASDLYVSQLAAARIARRGVPVVLTECIWETYSRRFATGGSVGVDEPRRHTQGRAIRRAIAALDTPLTHYCVLSVEEAEAFPGRWGVPTSRVHATGFCAPTADQVYLGPGPGGVFAGGNSLRDWRALLEIAPSLGARVTLASTLVPDHQRGDLTAGPLISIAYDAAAQAATVVFVGLVTPSERSSGQQTYLNAMLQGKPVVVTDSAGVRDHIEHGRTGLVVPPHDPAALRAALRELLDNPDLARRLGVAARESVLAGFTLPHYLDRILDIARGAVGDAASNGGAGEGRAS